MKRKAIDNMRKIQENIFACLIMRGDKVFGEILARTTKNGVCHLTFSAPILPSEIFYEEAGGCGYNKIDSCMRSLLENKNIKEELRNCGIKYESSLNWRKVFENNGYTIIDVI